MTLRTPNPYRSYQSLLDFQRSKERLAVLQEQITKDKRIVRISDDPSGVALIMDFQTSIERNKMYVKQGEAASSFLKGTESALNSINTQMDRLLELAELGVSEITPEHGREATAAEVNGLLKILFDVGNTKEQGKYIFSGTNTATQPFGWRDPAPDPFTLIDPITLLPVDSVVEYNGNLGNIDMDVSATASITTNLTGAYVFQGGTPPNPSQDIFTAVVRLREGLINDDTDQIRDAYNDIRAIKERINVCLATVGSRHVQLENSATNLEDFNEALQSIQNTYDGLNYPETYSKWGEEQTIQQAALATLAKMGGFSLFDYIG